MVPKVSVCPSVGCLHGDLAKDIANHADTYTVRLQLLSTPSGKEVQSLFTQVSFYEYLTLGRQRDNKGKLSLSTS